MPLALFLIANYNPNMTRTRAILKSLLVAVLAAALFLPAGCKRDNRRRHSSDVKIRVKLTRRFVRKNMERTRSEEPDEDDQVEVEECESEDDGKSFEDELKEDLAEVIFFIITLPIRMMIEDQLSKTIGTAKGYIWPREHRKRYCQRLYWGDNKVYLPKECKGTKVPMVIEFRGTYGGRFELELDLKRKKRLKLR
jgi:hypothetical protein